MRNIKAIGFLVLALVTALAAAVYAAGWVAQRGVNATRVVIAAADIELGSRITPQMLTTADWPSSAVPSGVYTDVKQLQDRVVKTSVLRGEPVLERKLSPAGTKGGLAAVIAEGKRAMTVRVNDVVGVAGFALPGNYVDVMVNTRQERGKPEGQVSMTVLEHVLVLAIAQEASRDETKPKVVSAVTLELTPPEAEKLDLARSVGTLSLVLRNQLDKKPIVTTGITREQLLGWKQPVTPAVIKTAAAAAPRPVARRVAAPPPVCVDVIRNGTRVPNCF